MTTHPDPCPLCGKRSQLSDEDLIPIWARTSVLRLGVFGPRDQRPRRMKMRICINCNSSLGRAFENDCSNLLKPMLYGTKVVLDRRQQILISCWIIKTSLLINLTGIEKSHPDHSLAVSILKDLTAERIPPAQTLVRIFKRDIEDEDTPVLVRSITAPPTAFFSVTTIGYLGWEMAIGPTGPILEYRSTGPHLPSSLEIWPPRESQINWPASSVASTTDVENLRAAYLAASKPGHGPPVKRQWR